jgi:hypothetical protein
MISENGKLRTEDLPEKAPTVPQAAHEFMEIMDRNNFSERIKLQTEVAIASAVLGQAQENLNNWRGENGQHLLETAKPNIKAIVDGLAKMVEAMGLDDQMRRTIANELWFALTLDIDSRASSQSDDSGLSDILSVL